MFVNNLAVWYFPCFGSNTVALHSLQKEITHENQDQPQSRQRPVGQLRAVTRP